MLATRVELAQKPRTTTATGFVTRVESPDQFDIGTLTVHIPPGAQCEVGNFRIKHYWYNLLLAPEMFATEETGRRYRRQVDYSTQPCDQLKLIIGSWVRVEGSYAPSTYVTARKIIAYKQSGGSPDPSGAVLEEDPMPFSSQSGTSRAFWLDGYPMIVNSQSEIRLAPPGTNLEANKRGSYSFHAYHSRLHSVPSLTQAEELRAGQCVTYNTAPQGTGTLLARSLVLWDCRQARSADRYARATSEFSWTPPDYARGLPGAVQYFRRKPLLRETPKGMVIPPDRLLQGYVTRVGMSVLPDYAKALTDTKTGAMHFHFVVVNSLGKFARYAHYKNGIGNHKYEDSVVPFPDGLILIAADSGIARLQNEAQLAALLSVAEAKVLQRQNYLSIESIGGINFGLPDIDAFGAWQEAQALRIGIRQLYLAGYDIREAPFAWLVANGKPVPNPVIGAGDPGATVPWYSSYAFDYMNRYYSDVDYSKLKRGEKEYAQFLDELRKTDLQAFQQNR